MSNVEYLEISKKVLEEYHLNEYRLEFIGQSANVIYRVIESDSTRRYVLRIPESASQEFEEVWSTKASIQSEVTWLEALTKESELFVPEPIYNKNNKLITEVRYDNKILNCTLLSWIEGEQKPYVPTVNDAAMVGKMIGKLHKQSSQWIVPDGFTRPTFDENKLDDALLKIQRAIDRGDITKDGETLILAGQKAKDMVSNLERTNSNWGVIHADLIPSNFIFHDDFVSPIDFGACGFGYYLFDIGWTLSYIHPSFREGLLHSYSTEFPLPSKNVDDLLEAFFVIGQLDTIGFWLGKPDSNEWLSSHISKLASRELNAFLYNKSFLYTGTPYWE